jgi:hypothetical protein
MTRHCQLITMTEWPSMFAQGFTISKKLSGRSSAMRPLAFRRSELGSTISGRTF